MKKVENNENAEDKAPHWMETDVLPLNQLGIKKKKGKTPVLSEIRKNKEIYRVTALKTRNAK